MGLFKEANCAHCGTKTSVLMRSKLQDGNYICQKCRKLIPSYLMAGIPDYTTENFEEIVQWKTDSIDQYSEIYSETHSYGCLSMDVTNGLFTLDYYKKGKTPILKFVDIGMVDFHFEPEEFKEGIFSSKVKGNSSMELTMNKPHFTCNITLVYGDTGRAKKGFFGKITYEKPERFQSAVLEFVSANINFMNWDDGSDPLSRALMIFSIEDPDNIDPEELETSREQLLELFSGGKMDRQIEIVNESYELLKAKAQK